MNVNISIIIILSISLPHIHHTTAAEYSPSIFCHISIKYEEPRTSLSNYLVKCTYYELLCTSTVVVSNTKEEGDTYQRWTRRSVINSDGFYKMNSSKFSLDGFFNHQHTKAVSCECFFSTNAHYSHLFTLFPSLPLSLSFLSLFRSLSFWFLPVAW